MSTYRDQARKSASQECNHVWEARAVWAWDDWVILRYERRCVVCGERPPLFRRIWLSLLDELRRLGLYDRLHQNIGAHQLGQGLHQEPPPPGWER